MHFSTFVYMHVFIVFTFSVYFVDRISANSFTAGDMERFYESHIEIARAAFSTHVLSRSL